MAQSRCACYNLKGWKFVDIYSFVCFHVKVVDN